MNTAQPENFNERILLVVSGMSPQIVTETLFALTRASDPAFVPTSVHLITTATGAEQARLNLLEGPAHFTRLCADYDIDPAIFTANNIHIIQDADGRQLRDIRSPAENEATADFITEKMLAFTTDAESALHVSIAGGRKTMGYYAGYALSLFGRSQDRLSHVLVSEGYEGLPKFYYPTPESRTIYNREQQALDASRAEVSLARIPFVRLRQGLSSSLLNGGHGFSKTVELARLAREPITLRINPKTRHYRIGDGDIGGKLPPSQMALLLWVAHRRARKQTPIAPLVEGERNAAYASELITLSEKHDLLLSAKTENRMQSGGGMDKGFLETQGSRLNKTLGEQLGPELANRCRFESRDQGGQRGYDLPANTRIAIRDEPD